MDAPICYLNGRYMDVRSATVSATDRGLLYGEGLFETWRTYKGKPFAVAEHIARLARSARQLGIPFDASEDWEGRSVDLVRCNSAQESGSAIRLTITRGSGPLQLAPPQTSAPTRLMLLRHLDAGLAAAREQGVAVHLAQIHRDKRISRGELKTINYLPAVIGKTAAVERGCFETIYRLPDSTLLEGTTSNLFVVHDREIVTTPLSAGVLPGVTRAIVMKLARSLARVREGRITADMLKSCDEAFLTATTIEVVPIVRAGRGKAGGGRPGPLTRNLQQGYRKLVARRLQMDVEQLGE